MLSNNKGFSLIELMVVVAIIAILSTIAIPSYQVFQAKARQKEGFALLGGYFQAAHASRTEYNFFPGNLVGTGFAPVGTMNYGLWVADSGNALPYGQNNDNTCLNLEAACDCTADTGDCTGYKEWVMGTLGSAGTIGYVGDGNEATAPAVGPNTFLAVTAGWISTKAADQDEYTMDHQKALLMVTDGTK